MFAGWVNTAALLRIRSTSSTGPENPRLAVWLEIAFEQASKGIICVSFFLSLVSNPHIPPTIDLKEQHTFIFTQWDASQLSVFKNVSLKLLQSGDFYFWTANKFSPFAQNKQKLTPVFILVPTFLIKFIWKKVIATTFLSFHKVFPEGNAAKFLLFPQVMIFL